jgi:hypothetical protein
LLAPLQRRAAQLLLVVAVLSSPCVAAADDEAPRRRPWVVPDHAKLQLAGQIGFLSPGIGYALAGDDVEVDVLLGWVPPFHGADDIWSVSGKITYAPLHLRVGSRWRIEPFRAALQLTYTFGPEYFADVPDRYPSGYYDLPTAWHSGVAFGGAVTRRGHGGRGREVGFFAEAVALPLQLRDWWRNRNVIDASDVLTVAAGVMVGF